MTFVATSTAAAAVVSCPVSCEYNIGAPRPPRQRFEPITAAAAAEGRGLCMGCGGDGGTLSTRGREEISHANNETVQTACGTHTADRSESPLSPADRSVPQTGLRVLLAGQPIPTGRGA